MSKIFYVELERKEYFFRDVPAETQEEAENIVLLAAGGNPADWKIVRSEEVAHDPKKWTGSGAVDAA